MSVKRPTKCFRLNCPKRPTTIVPVMEGVSIVCCADHLEHARETAQTGRRAA